MKLRRRRRLKWLTKPPGTGSCPTTLSQSGRESKLRLKIRSTTRSTRLTKDKNGPITKTHFIAEDEVTFKLLMCAALWTLTTSLSTCPGRRCSSTSSSRQNASRALNHEVLLSFEEQRKVLKTLLTVSGYRPDIPLSDARTPAAAGRARDFASEKPRNKKGNPDKRQAMFKTKSGALIGVCYGYNDAGSRPCANTPFRDGCRRTDGTSFAHVCNVFVAAQDKHCLGKHPRKQHR